jgi:hypothetical protein
MHRGHLEFIYEHNLTHFLAKGLANLGVMMGVRQETTMLTSLKVDDGDCVFGFLHFYFTLPFSTDSYSYEVKENKNLCGMRGRVPVLSQWAIALYSLLLFEVLPSSRRTGNRW